MYRRRLAGFQLAFSPKADAGRMPALHQTSVGEIPRFARNDQFINLESSYRRSISKRTICDSDLLAVNDLHRRTYLLPLFHASQ